MRCWTRLAKVVAECIGNPHSWTTGGVSLKLNEKHCFCRSIGSDNPVKKQVFPKQKDSPMNSQRDYKEKKRKEKKTGCGESKIISILADHTSCCDSQSHQGTSYSSQTESTNQITLLPVTVTPRPRKMIFHRFTTHHFMDTGSLQFV